MVLMGWGEESVSHIPKSKARLSGGGGEIKLCAFATRRQQLRLCQRSRLI